MRSISTNYSRNPQQKVSVFLSFIFFFLSHIFLPLIVLSWRQELKMANEADEVLLGKQATAIKNHGKCTEKLQSENVES